MDDEQLDALIEAVGDYRAKEAEAKTCMESCEHDAYYFCADKIAARDQAKAEVRRTLAAAIRAETLEVLRDMNLIGGAE